MIDIDTIPNGSVVLMFDRDICDHRVLLLADALSHGCPHCKAAERVLVFRPPVRLFLGPEFLGSCDDCGVSVPMTGHLWKQPSGKYACEDCDIVTKANDCARMEGV